MQFRAFLPLLLFGAALGAPSPKTPNKYVGLVGLGKGKHGAVPGKYIVVLHDDQDSDEFTGNWRSSGSGAIHRKFKKGFSGAFSDLDLDVMRAHPAVKYIEQVQLYATVDDENPSTYGLAQLSESGVLASGDQTTYSYATGGAPVTVYIVDTGIDTSHPDFGGRATFGIDLTGEGEFDGEGHGTHVTGTVGGTVYGVAKEASLVAVKVLDSSGNGQNDIIIQGIEWVTDNHAGPSIINMSLGGGFSQAVNDAVQAAYDAGIVVVVAAGNQGEQGIGACSQSPSSSDYAIAVGAIDTNYQVASFSSEDSCVDMHAAGVGVWSTWPNSEINILDGTSMASPHIAGLAAYIFSNYGAVTTDDVWNTMLQYQETDIIGGDLRGAPNVLGNNGYNKQ